MLRYLNKLLHDNRYIDDIIQESYLKVWRHRDQIDPDQPLDNWLFIILRNTALIQLEKQLAEKEKRIGMTSMGNRLQSTTDHNEGQVHLQQRDSEKNLHSCTALHFSSAAPAIFSSSRGNKALS